MASHPVGHSAEGTKKRSATVLLQSVTLALRTGGLHAARKALRSYRKAMTLLHGDQVAFVAIPNPNALLAGRCVGLASCVRLEMEAGNPGRFLQVV